MVSPVITHLDQVDADWLTDVLTRSGALSAGRVLAFEADSGGGAWSSNARLRLRYDEDAQGERPKALFLKLVDTDTGDGEFFLPAEVTTYTNDYVDVPDAPLVRCYDAAFDPASQRYHVLLDDLTETHTDARDFSPTRAYGRALAEALAILHGRWWGRDRLDALGAPRHDEAHLRRFVAIAEPGAAHVRAKLGGELEPEWPDLIDELFVHLSELVVARMGDERDFTQIHCDPNPGNIMVPRVGVRPLYLIDSQPFDWSLTTWLGAYDLAYAMTLYWEPETRRAFERPSLRRYHDTLARRGVVGYSWEQLLADYRLNAALCVAVAVEYMRGGGDPRWRDFVVGLLRRALTAFEDLGGPSLWRR